VGAREAVSYVFTAEIESDVKSGVEATTSYEDGGQRRYAVQEEDHQKRWGTLTPLAPRQPYARLLPHSRVIRASLLTPYSDSDSP